MSETSPKSPELIQAQIAAFAEAKIPRYADKSHVLRNIGTLSVGPVENVTRVLAGNEHHPDANGKSARATSGTERLVATSAEYKDYLRSVGGSGHESIRGRADLLSAYSDFEPVVNEQWNELSDPATLKSHPIYLGSGSNATVFSIERDNKKYAVRMPKGNAKKPELIDAHLAGAVLGKGVPHLEQIVAASYKDGVTVAEVMPGKEIGKLEAEEAAQVTNEQLRELVDTLIEAHNRGIGIDTKPSNLLYDANEGYGIIDYHSTLGAEKRGEVPTLGELIGTIGMVLENTGRYGKSLKSEKTVEDFEQEARYAKANYDVLTRYRDQVEEKLTNDDDKEVALKLIDERLEGIKDKATNPDWVNERLAQDQKWRQEREAARHQADTDDDDDFIF